MKRMLTIGLMIVLSGLWLACSQAQDFDLRTRIVHADDVIPMTSALELTRLASSTAPEVRVLGDRHGTLYFYGFSNASQVQRLGRLYLEGQIAQIAGIPGEARDDGFVRYLLAVVASSRLYLLTYEAPGAIIPRGLVQGVSASCVSMSWTTQPGGSVQLVVGTTDGRILVYNSVGVPSPQSSPHALVNLGNPTQIIVLPSNGPVRRVILLSNQLIAAVGQTIYRYTLQSGQYVLSGKDMRLFAPVAEMTVNGSYIVAASEDGYVYAWTLSNGALAGMLKERYNGNLGPNCLCALPNNRVAVGYRSVRLYNLPNFEEVGEAGVPLIGLSESGNAQQYSPIRPSAYSFGYTVLPLYSSGTNMPIAAAQEHYPRVSFITPVPYHRRYAAPASRPPIYAVASVSNSQIPFGIAYGYADGLVRVYNLQAAGSTPALAINLGRPVFALAFANFRNAPWLLISAGALGEVFAWNLNTNQSVAVIPPSSAPRVLYGVKVQAVGNTLVFWTAASDGKLEQWSWGGAGNATRSRDVAVMNAPLWSLDINSIGHVAVAGAEGVRYLVGTTLLNDADHWRAYSVAFRPGRPYEFAVSAFERIGNSLTRTPRLYLYQFDNTIAPGDINNTLTLERGYRSTFPYVAVDHSPVLLSWLNQDLVAAAAIYGGKVRLYNCSSRSLHYSDLRADDWGTWDNNIVDAYEPVRDGVLAFTALSNGTQLAAGSAGGEGVVWGRSAINWGSFFLGSPNSIDFLRSGHRVYAGRIFDPTTNFHIPLHFQYLFFEPVVLPHSTGDLIVFGPDRAWFTNRIRFASNFPDNLETIIGVQVDQGAVLQDTSHGSLKVARLQGSASGTTWSGFCRIVDLQNPNSPSIITSPNLTVAWPDGGNVLYLALAPSGTRFAVLEYRSNQVQVWTSSGGNWSSATFSLPIPPGNPPNYSRALRFVTDNLLLVAYPDGSPQTWRLALYNWNGSSWTPVGMPVDTQLTYYGNLRSSASTGRFIDVVIVNGVPRVAFSGGDGLAFYKITNNTLQLVGRSTLSSSGFMECMHYGWVRFNRQNPNRVGVASAYGPTALELDVSNLNWQ